MDILQDFKDKLNIYEIVEQFQNLPQIECPVKHHFADGQYLRETAMPKGTFAIGKKHKFSTINIIIKGKLSVYQGEGNPILHIEAPVIWTSDAGVQKMAYFHEDTTWLNAHPTDETDLKIIEDIFIVNEDLETNKAVKE